MSAPAAIVPGVIERYGPVLDAMRPGCTGEERRLRCGILYLRDRATAAGKRARWEAGVVLGAIESLAAVHAFTSMPIAELRELRDQLTRMMMAATGLEVRGPGSIAHAA